MNFTGKLKILFVEDMQSDQQLAEFQLISGGFTFISQRVEDEASFRQAMDMFKPDLIISDYSMPEFDGMQALQIAIELAPDIPVIILTGSINEETAVKCLKAGAADYVLKDRMMRLPFAVRDALEQSTSRINSQAAQKKLEEQEQELSAIFENSPVLMILVDDQVRIRKINGVDFGSESLNGPSNFGLKFGDAIRCIYSLDNPDGCGAGFECQTCLVRQLLLQTFRTGEPINQADIRITKMTGSGHQNIDVLLSTSKLRIQGRQMVLVSLLDITAKKETDELLLRERSLLRTLIDNLPDRIFFKDLDSKFVIANTGVAAHISAGSPGDLIGKSDFDFYPPDHASEYFKNEQELLRTGIPLINHVEPAVDSMGITGWTQTSKIPVRDSDGNIFGLVGVSRDITEIKRNQEDLIHAKEIAEQSTRLKDAFIANISHEIRTPLNAILGFSDLIRESLAEYSTGQTDTYFGIVENSGQRLLRTVSMILNLSRLQVGEIAIHPNQLDINFLVEQLIKEYNLPAQKKSLELIYHSDNKDRIIFSDEYFITHSVSNLIENAIKYTNLGNIRVSLSDLPDGGIRLDVEDTGIGISQEYLQRIFDPFTQEEIGYTRSFEGIGLGLSITQGFLASIGARLLVESEKGKGSKFTVLFPREIT